MTVDASAEAGGAYEDADESLPDSPVKAKSPPRPARGRASTSPTIPRVSPRLPPPPLPASPPTSSCQLSVPDSRDSTLASRSSSTGGKPRLSAISTFSSGSYVHVPLPSGAKSAGPESSGGRGGLKMGVGNASVSSLGAGIGFDFSPNRRKKSDAGEGEDGRVHPSSSHTPETCLTLSCRAALDCWDDAKDESLLSQVWRRRIHNNIFEGLLRFHLSPYQPSAHLSTYRVSVRTPRPILPPRHHSLPPPSHRQSPLFPPPTLVHLPPAPLPLSPLSSRCRLIATPLGLESAVLAKRFRSNPLPLQLSSVAQRRKRWVAKALASLSPPLSCPSRAVAPASPPPLEHLPPPTPPADDPPPSPLPALLPPSLLTRRPSCHRRTTSRRPHHRLENAFLRDEQAKTTSFSASCGSGVLVSMEYSESALEGRQVPERVRR